MSSQVDSIQEHHEWFNHIKQHYPGQEPMSLTTVIKYWMGGNDFLDYVYVFCGTSEKTKFWHYISYGLGSGGFGFELSFRLKVTEEEDTSRNFNAPYWPRNLMQNLARYVFQSGNVFRPGDHMPANGPIYLEDKQTMMRNFIFRKDPILGSYNSPAYGRFETQNVD